MNRVAEYLLITLVAAAVAALMAPRLAGLAGMLAAPKVRVEVHSLRVITTASGVYVQMVIDNVGSVRVCVEKVIVSWGGGFVVLGDGDSAELAPRPCIPAGGEVYYAGWQGGAWVPPGSAAVTLVLSTPTGTANVTVGARVVAENG